ncbi:MAG: iron export ABC transporter permease subunit FetB [Desulfobulbaceae bacterium]|nr:iron export ABC transporter permease subunit FetB [Desulfobulbaceae bacterium]
MHIIELSFIDLNIAALLILGVAGLSWHMRLQLEKKLFVAALRTTVQLLLIGHVLRIVFASSDPWLVAIIALFMLLVAGREVMARQHRKIRGWSGWLLGTGALFVSSFTVTVFALVLLIGNDPWYAPQYAIPLLGMLFGNTMNGVALSMDRLTDGLWQQRRIVEQRLLLGQTSDQATREIRQDAMRSGMIPIINSMAAAGIVSLPGMMTGQILSGTEPVIAVKYQILIMFLIASGTGFGVVAAIWMAGKKLFDQRHRLRLERLR